ncbi:hypothetical protein BGZ82_007837 [Podila clonocystis]|nr:hypothetical protein BGZ82_007837 [Podila clonocystis]
MPSLTSLGVLLVVVLHCIFALPSPDVPSPPDVPSSPGVPVRPDFTVLEHIDTIPNPWVDGGPASTDQIISVSIGFKLPNFADFERQFMDISTPGSPTYGQFLSAEQIFALLDPAKEVVDLVINWLKGFKINATHDHQWLTLKATVLQLNTLLNTEYHVYHHPTTSETIIRTLSYSIPSVLVQAIDVVLPGTSFDGDLSHGQTSTSPSPSPVLEKRLVKRATCSDQVTPNCLRGLYGIPTTRATEAQNMIAVPGFLEEYANREDLALFLKNFRSDLNPPPTFIDQSIDGGRNPQDRANAGIEANLDIQYTVGLANGVTTVFISSGLSSINGFINIAIKLLGQVVTPSVLSLSYGFNENTVSRNTANNLCNLFAQLGARGTSVIVASGDGGVAGSEPSDTCNQFLPTFPASCPFVTAVGATKGVPEVGAELSAGGFSNHFGRPKYQASAVDGYLNKLGAVYQGRYNRNGRAYPDISAQGKHIVIALKGASELVDGTSASAPIFASIVALLNDRLISRAGRPLGFLNPLLYANPNIWNDIKTGSNPSCGTQGFPAQVGWDPVTGLGTPNFAKFANYVDVLAG